MECSVVCGGVKNMKTCPPMECHRDKRDVYICVCDACGVCIICVCVCEYVCVCE